VDVLDDLLARARARDGVFNLTIMDPPWALQICEEAPLALATPVRGSAWGPARRHRAGPVVGA
jgi:Cupin